MVRNTRNATIKTVTRSVRQTGLELSYGTLDGTGNPQNREIDEATWLGLNPANTHSIVPSRAHWPES